MSAWAYLSWSRAALVALCVLMAVGALIVALTPRPMPRKPSPWPVVDYSSKFQVKRAWLGKRWLLARPINRRGLP